MKVKKLSFDVREISGLQAGVGRIITALIGAMREIDNEREFIYFGSASILPENLNGTYVDLGTSGLLWHLKCAKMLWCNPQWGTYISVRSPIVPIILPDRSIYFVNDLISFKYPDYFTLKTRIVESLFVKLALKKVKHIVAISQSTARDIEKLCPEAKTKTKVVPLAADPMFKKAKYDIEILKRHGVEKPYILSVGTIEPRKNHLSLLSAYQKMPRTLRDNYDLVLIGKRGWRCNHIMNAINEQARTGSVKYLEFISDSDLVHFYNGASLFVYPSFYEGFGLPIVEAMSCGVPVITSNLSSMPEVGGNAAYYIDPNKIEEITDAMVKILTQKELANKMSSMGLFQSSEYSWQKAAKAIYNIVDNG